MDKHPNAFQRHMAKYPDCPRGFGKESYGNKAAMDGPKYLAYCHAIWADSFYRVDYRQMNASRDFAEGAGIVYG